jgi:hypothetical protein
MVMQRPRAWTLADDNADNKNSRVAQSEVRIVGDQP